MCFQFYPEQTYHKKCQEHMPHFSAADIRISLLFEENAIFCPGTI